MCDIIKPIKDRSTLRFLKLSLASSAGIKQFLTFKKKKIGSYTDYRRKNQEDSPYIKTTDKRRIHKFSWIDSKRASILGRLEPLQNFLWDIDNPKSQIYQWSTHKANKRNTLQGKPH